MGPNEKEGKASSSGTGSSDWVKTDWVILNRHATGSSWTEYATGSSWSDYADWTDTRSGSPRIWVILNRSRLGLLEQITRINGYADWTGTRSGSSWTDCADWTDPRLGSSWADYANAGYADRVFLNWFTRSERIRDWYVHWVFLNWIHESLQLNLSCHSTNSVHRLDDWRIYSDYEELTEAA